MSALGRKQSLAALSALGYKQAPGSNPSGATPQVLAPRCPFVWRSVSNWLELCRSRLGSLTHWPSSTPGGRLRFKVDIGKKCVVHEAFQRLIRGDLGKRTSATYGFKSIVERTFNLLVEGSNPSRPTNQIRYLAASWVLRGSIFWENSWENRAPRARIFFI